MTYVVYILECSDNTYYTGCTNDLQKRLHQHNNSKAGAHYTKIRRPVRLVYQEEYPTFGGARRREMEIQKWSRVKKEALWK